MKFLLVLLTVILIGGIWLVYKYESNEGRYRADNARLGPPVQEELRIVFMGDSITEGWEKIRPFFFKGKPYVNRGISGQTTQQMLDRFEGDVIQLRPAVVVILGGTNDIAGNGGEISLSMIFQNIVLMAEQAQAGGIKVILCSVLPVYDFPWSPGLQPAEQVAALNRMIKDYASSHGITYCDYYSSLVDDRKGMKSEYSGDGVHPNAKGYEVMEPIIAEAIEKVAHGSI